MRLFAMSDIHGMYGSLMRRIEQIDKIGNLRNGEDKLILLGDYVDLGLNSFKVSRTIYELQEDIRENMVVLMGNHDKWFLDFLEGKDPGWISEDRAWITLAGFMPDEEISVLKGIFRRSKPGTDRLMTAARFCKNSIMAEHEDMINWMKKLPLYHETDRQIFVHAGIDEEAGDLWAVGTSNDTFISKYPATRGKFYKDIIAGHVSVASLKRNPGFHDIYWDGENHYYIDGIDSYRGSVRDDNRVIPVLVYSNNEREAGYYSLSEDGEMMLINRTGSVSDIF